MKRSVFEAYLEDGEELLWEGFCSRDRSLPFDFQASSDKWSSLHISEKLSILVLIIFLGFLIYRDAPSHEFEHVFFQLLWFLTLVFRLHYQIFETDQYLNGVARDGFVFAVTNNRMMMYNYSTRKLSRQQSITPDVRALEHSRGLTINSPGAKKWVWPLGNASARTAVKVIREARDRIKAEAA